MVEFEKGWESDENTAAADLGEAGRIRKVANLRTSTRKTAGQNDIRLENERLERIEEKAHIKEMVAKREGTKKTIGIIRRQRRTT